MFLIVGCQTTQSAETETKPEVVKEVKALPKEKEVVAPKKEVTKNPFKNVDIPPNQVVTTAKPVVCGRIDTILGRMENVHGEKPVMLGQTPDKGETQAMVTLTYNPNTGSFTFMEQMPIEERLVCILSTGHGKLMGKPVGSSY